MSERWPNVPLGEVLVERQETPSAEDILSGKIRIVAKIAFHDGKIQLRESVETKTKMILIRPGDFVVSGINAAKGAVAIYGEESSDSIAATIHYGSYIPNKYRVNVSYLWWLLRSQTFRDLLSEYVPGGIKTELKAKRLLPIPVPLPSVYEQERIVKRINEITIKIRQLQLLHNSRIKLEEAVIKSQLNKLFGNPYSKFKGELNILSRSRIGDLVTDVADGPHVTPRYVEDGIPFVTVLNITSGKVDFRGAKYITKEDHVQFQKRAKVERGDVLISKDGTIGVPCYVDVDEDFSFFVSVALMKPKKDLLDGQFLTWVLQAPYLQERIKERSRGDMIRHLVLREIRELLIPVLSMDDQKRIVNYLNELRIKDRKRKQLEDQTVGEISALLPSILDKAFKGDL